MYEDLGVYRAVLGAKWDACSSLSSNLPVSVCACIARQSHELVALNVPPGLYGKTSL